MNKRLRLRSTTDVRGALARRVRERRRQRGWSRREFAERSAVPDVAAVVGAVAKSLSRWPTVARGFDVMSGVIGRIGTRLARTRRENGSLPGL